MSLLTLDPDTTLYFNKTSATTSPSRVLKITNTSNGFVAFKVKTTAPKAYLVRPSSGTLKPKEQNQVQIIVQTGEYNVQDRFLVQAVPVQDGGPVQREAFNNFTKDQLQEQKLAVVVEECESEEPNKAGGAAGFGTGGNDAKTGVAVGDGATLQVKYDELVNYTLTLEKEKKKLDADLAALVPKANATSNGYSLMTMLVAVFVAFILPYLCKVAGVPIL